MGNVESPVRDRLQRAYKDALDAIDDDLQAVTRMIADARAAGIDVSPDWLRRQGRYKQLMADVEREYARFSNAGVRILQDGQARAVSGGAQQAWELMEAEGVTLGSVGFGARVNTQAAEALAHALHRTSPLRKVLDAYGKNASNVIEEHLFAAIIEGKGAREVAREIRRAIGGGANRARIDALVRTEMARAFNRSLDVQYREMSNVIAGYRWVAAKGPRTCLGCLAMDGKVFKRYQHRFHVNCRCLCTPVSIFSTVQYEDGDAWFARQPEKTQRAMMPSREAFEAYREGDVKLIDFRGIKHDPVWGTSIYQRSGREALAKARAA